MRNFMFIQQISIRIILLFGVAILTTFLSDYLDSIGWFNDTFRTKYHTKDNISYYGYPPTEKIIVWSVRHCLYFWMSFTLFITQLAGLIIYFIKRVEKTYEIKVQ